MYDYMTYRKVLAILESLQLLAYEKPGNDFNLDAFENDVNGTCITHSEMSKNHFPFCLIWVSFYIHTDEKDHGPDFFFKMNEGECEIGSETGKIPSEKSSDWKAMIGTFCKNVHECL